MLKAGMVTLASLFGGRPREAIVQVIGVVVLD